MTEVYISICIPAYKRVQFLARLLDSIALQDYQSFEVVLTDDSPGMEVEELCKKYMDKFKLAYKKNTIALGMPENWNEAIRISSGKWIKLMHDDDWFATPGALSKFAALSEKESNAMIFSAYNDILLSGGQKKRKYLSSFRFKQVLKEPVTLLSRNIIGPPSVVMHKNDGCHLYDVRLKWLVDIDMYMRRMQDDRLVYLSEALINVGVGDEQVTSSVHGNPLVEIPEHFYLIQKTGIKHLRHILVYDYWWRLFRNFHILTLFDIRKFGYDGSVHPVLQSMMAWQRKFPRILLNQGVFSKTIMFLHFCFHRNRIGK